MKLASLNIDMDCAIGDALKNGYIVGFEDKKFQHISFGSALNRFLECLDQNNAKATFFVIAKTAECKDVAAALKNLVDQGHEIASHTWSHPKNLHNLTDRELDKELRQSKHFLEDITGQKVDGFRAPGYSFNQNILDTLISAGYSYSSTVNVSIVYNLAKWLFSALKSPKDKTALYYVNPKFLRSPSEPYFPDVLKFWKRGTQRDFVEVPLSVDPFRLFQSTFWSNLVLMPRWLQEIYWGSLARTTFANIEFHDFEFYDHDDFDEQDDYHTRSAAMIFKIPLHSRLESAHKILKIMSSQEFVTLRDVVMDFKFKNLDRHQ